MYIDYDVDTYPFRGVFYRYEIDESKPLDERVETRVDVYTTDCDITEGGVNKNPEFISASFSIYFPFLPDVPFPIKRGDNFEGFMYGMAVNGQVLGVFPTAMGAVAYLKDLDIE